MDFGALAVAALPAFVASAVEFVEATTIILAVGVTRGWRAPIYGTLAAALTLGAIIALLGVTIVAVVPEHVLKAFVGALLLLFGLRWLRKAILRFAGIVALHDEERIYLKEVAELRAQGRAKRGFDRIGAVVAYKAVLLEGTEVAFIVIAFGAGGATALNAAIVGAVAAGILVIALGVALRAPLTMVPENWMKFGVGAILSAFGVFWFSEGLGVQWPGDALSIPLVLAVFLGASWISVRLLRAMLPEGAEVAARSVQSALRGVWEAVWGLLVEDGSLAVGIVAALAATGILAAVLSDGTRDEVGWLLLGLLVILVMFNVHSAGRRARRLTR